jgi:hypothetical protein
LVSHQSFDKVENHSTPQFAVAEGVKAKYKRYMENYHIRREDIIPLVFDTYGGYSPEAYRLLQQMATSMSDGDQLLSAQIMRRLRDRIAVALHTGHGEVINWLNSMDSHSIRKVR